MTTSSQPPIASAAVRIAARCRIVFAVASRLQPVQVRPGEVEWCME